MNARIKTIVTFIALLLFTLGASSNGTSAASWTVSFPSPDGQIKALAVYNGKLYAGGFTGQSNAHLYVYDGSTWNSLNFAPGTGVSLDMIEALQAYNNRLYIGTRVHVGTTYYSRVYYYDGENFVLDFSAPGKSNTSGIEDLVIHNNLLFAANGICCPPGAVYQRVTDNNWISVGDSFPSPEAVRALASYKGNLYAGTSSGWAKVYRWTGSAWELNANITDLLGVNQTGVWSFAANDDFLYAGTAGSNVASIIPVYDGITWTNSIAASGNTRLSVINDQIWAGSGDGKIYWNNGSWQDYGTVNNVFEFVEYKGYIYAAGSNGSVYRTESPNRYSVTGKIVDTDGKAIPNVVISDGAGHTAISNSLGLYTLGDLTWGTYTITPTNTNYIFSPVSITSEIPPNAPDKNFTGTLLDFTNPNGYLIIPGDGTTIGPGTITVAAEAWDNSGGSGVDHVEFYVLYDGSYHLIGTDFTTPYDIQWATPNNLRSQKLFFSVHIYDRSGNHQASAGGLRTVNFSESENNLNVHENWILESHRAYLNQRSLEPGGDSKCSTASMTMILAMNGLISVDYASMSNKANEMYPRVLNANGDAYVGAMAVELRRQGMIVATNPYTTDSAWITLRQEIDAGRPVIIRTAHGSVTYAGHFFVAVGYRETDSSRQAIVYDPFGRWKGTCCTKNYDLNTREPESNKGQWVYYDFDSAFGRYNWLITARTNTITNGQAITVGVPSSPPDAMSDEPENIGTYLGVNTVTDIRIYLPLVIR
jgi:hypothetical protein